MVHQKNSKSKIGIFERIAGRKLAMRSIYQQTANLVLANKIHASPPFFHRDYVSGYGEGTAAAV